VRSWSGADAAVAGDGGDGLRFSDYLPVVLLAVMVGAQVLWVRLNLDLFRPVLESSLLFFELILAATVIAVLRNAVGVRSFGVFGPAIIALGLVGAGLLQGLVVYVDVFLVAMVASLSLHNLGMTSSYRVAVVISVTAITITVLELAGELFHTHGLEVGIFFPVLITSWLADRYVMQVKELDWLDPSRRLLGTFIAVLVAFAVITYEPLVSLVALNPETWGIIILVNVLLARKAGFRLSERLRFRPVLHEVEDADDVLGLNRRNRDLMVKYNPRHLFPAVRKDRMKAAFHQLDVPAPATYAVVEDRRGLETARRVFETRDSFVIKPASGFGGEGILVVRREGGPGGPLMARGREWSVDGLVSHVAQILDGQYSHGLNDVAIVEQRVVSDPRIARFHAAGVPDIRVIVLEGFPVMSMVRLPTKESRGAANLHKGAIGMGLTIADGRGVNPFWRGHGGTVDRHPDTGAVLEELSVPDWTRLLEIASRAQGASRLGYAGVDMVLDESGPMVLEVNKRPGLEIQNTNLAGLMRRIRRVEEALPEHRFSPVSERVRMSQDWDRGGWA